MSDIQDFRDLYGAPCYVYVMFFEQHGLGENRVYFLSLVAIRPHSMEKLDLLGDEEPEFIYKRLERVVDDLHTQCVEEAVAQWEEDNVELFAPPPQIFDEQIPGTY